MSRRSSNDMRGRSVQTTLQRIVVCAPYLPPIEPPWSKRMWNTCACLMPQPHKRQRRELPAIIVADVLGIRIAPRAVRLDDCAVHRMPLTSAQKIAAFRARRRDAGLCVDCGANPNPARPGHVTCLDCSLAAAERVRRIRAAKKAT